MENQNTSLQEEISKLQELCKRMEDMDMNESRFEPPATEEEILNWEFTNGITIPETYKEWLRFSNGSEIEGLSAGFLCVKKMVVNYKFISEDMVIIGHLGGGGDSICFSKTTGKFVILHDSWNDDFDSFKGVILNLISMCKSILGEDKLTNKVGAMMLDILKAKKNSPEGLTEEQAKALAMMESKEK